MLLVGVPPFGTTVDDPDDDAREVDELAREGVGAAAVDGV